MPTPGAYIVPGFMQFTGRRPNASAALYDAQAMWWNGHDVQRIKRTGSAGSYAYEWENTGGGMSAFNAATILALAKASRSASDRGKALGTSPTDQDALALLDIAGLTAEQANRIAQVPNLIDKTHGLLLKHGAITFANAPAGEAQITIIPSGSAVGQKVSNRTAVEADLSGLTGWAAHHDSPSNTLTYLVIARIAKNQAIQQFYVNQGNRLQINLGWRLVVGTSTWDYYEVGTISGGAGSTIEKRAQAIVTTFTDELGGEALRQINALISGHEDTPHGGAGGGSSELTPVIVPSTTTAISLGIQGQSTWPSGMSRAGGLSGTVYWRDYRDLHGKQFIIDSDTVTAVINLHMADLMSANAAAGGRDETKSREFEIVDRRSEGGITFTGGGVADIVPEGARIEPGYKAKISLTPWKVNRWLLALGAFTPFREEVTIPPYSTITVLPAGMSGTAFKDAPKSFRVLLFDKLTSKRVTGAEFVINGTSMTLDAAATPVDNLNHTTDVRSVLKFDFPTGVGVFLDRVSSSQAAVPATVTLTFDDGSQHFHNFGWLVNDDFFAERFKFDDVVDKSADYALVAADLGKTIRFTGATARTATLPGITASGAVTPGWFATIKNSMTAALTIDRAAGDRLDGGTTRILAPGQSATIQAVGTNDWETIHTNAKSAFDPQLVFSGNVVIANANRAAAGGFTWPADAPYLLVQVNPPGDYGEQIFRIRNPRLGRGLLDNTPVAVQEVGDNLADADSVGFNLVSPAGLIQTYKFGATAAWGALVQCSNSAADPAPLVVARD